MAMLKSATPGWKITEESVKSQLHLTGKQGAQLERIVLAGRKVLFSKESHQLMLKELDGPGTISQKIGQGVAGLMALLWQEHPALPPNLMIPGGMLLVVVVADFLKKAGQEVTDAEIGGAIETMTTAILHAGGIDSDKVASMGDKASTAPAQPAKPAQKAVMP